MNTDLRGLNCSPKSINILYYTTTTHDAAVRCLLYVERYYDVFRITGTGVHFDCRKLVQLIFAIAPMPS